MDIKNRMLYIRVSIKIICVLIPALLILSCKSEVDPMANVPVINLKSECLLKNTDIYMKFAYKIKVQDSLMCIWDLHGADKFYHIYSYPDLKLITSFGIQGRGDQELVNTGGFDIDKNYIYVFDSYRAKLYIYSIDSLLYRHTTPTNIINYPPKCIPVLAFTKMENGFALLNYNGKERITLVDLSGNIIEKKYQIPQKVNSKNQPYLASLWDSFIDYNPENKIMGIVTKLGEVLEIYNFTNDSTQIIIGKGGIPDIYKKRGRLSIGKIDGFSDIQIKSDLIYALYSGLDRVEASKLWEKGINTPDGGNYIRVYDILGNIKKIYKLDQHINGFDVHEEEGIIYTVSSSEENSISKYNLN